MSRPGTLAADLIDWPDRIAILQRVCDEKSVRHRDLVSWYIAAHPLDDDARADLRAHLTVMEHRDVVMLTYRADFWCVEWTSDGRSLLARARHAAKAAAATSPRPAPASRGRRQQSSAGLR